MRLMLVGLALVWSVVGVGARGWSEAQEGLTRRDAQGPVTVAVTLIPSPAAGAPIKVKVVLDTHSAALDAVVLEQAVAVVLPDGTERPPSAVEQASGSGHHREAVLVFPLSPPPGTVRVVVRNVGGVAERAFAWEPGAR